MAWNTSAVSQFLLCFNTSMVFLLFPKTTVHGASSIEVFIATWNVNGKSPEELNLKKLLNAYLAEDGENALSPGLIVIGIQEIVPLNYDSYKKPTKDIEDNWNNHLFYVLNAMNASANITYNSVEYTQMYGIALFLYIRDATVNIKLANRVKRGLFNIIGNNGAVAIRFVLNETAFCLYSCHLAAHYSKRKERKKNMAAIMDKMFDKGQCDRTIVFGDLNFRVAKDPKKSCKIKAFLNNRLCSGDKREFQFPKDEQLYSYMTKQKHSVWKQFHEEEITFMPTYNLDPETGDYEMGSEDERREKKKNREAESKPDPEDINFGIKGTPNSCLNLAHRNEGSKSDMESGNGRRIPAWCDRILWKEKDTITMKILGGLKTSYISPPLTGSDHTPVVILLEVNYKENVNRPPKL